MYSTGMGHMGDLEQVSAAVVPVPLQVKIARVQCSGVSLPHPNSPTERPHPDPVGLAECKAPEAVEPVRQGQRKPCHPREQEWL